MKLRPVTGTNEALTNEVTFGPEFEMGDSFFFRDSHNSRKGSTNETVTSKTIFATKLNMICYYFSSPFHNDCGKGETLVKWMLAFANAIETPISENISTPKSKWAGACCHFFGFSHFFKNIVKRSPNKILTRTLMRYYIFFWTKWWKIAQNTVKHWL